jgi:hypothetical protein
VAEALEPFVRSLAAREGRPAPIVEELLDDAAPTPKGQVATEVDGRFVLPLDTQRRPGLRGKGCLPVVLLGAALVGAWCRWG